MFCLSAMARAVAVGVVPEEQKERAVILSFCSHPELFYQKGSIVMSKGRPPLGPELVEHLDGSDPAKLRLKLILQTLSGSKTVLEASAELGVSESRFHELRSEWLQQSLAPLEPKPLGRPRPVMTPEQAQIEELKGLVERLSKELARSQIKEELALSMPQLFLRSNRNEPPIETAKKKTLAKYFRAARLNASNASGNSKESSA